MPRDEKPDLKGLTWSDSYIKYLGIRLTRNYHEWEKVNLDLLKEKLQSQTLRLESMSLGLWAKLNVIKMDLLPKINFVFNNLHVRISTKSEGMLNGIIKTFLWGKGRPQISRKRLETLTKEGGFGLPIFRLYQDAAILRNAAWLLGEESSDSPRWATQEKMHTWSEGICVYSYLLGDKMVNQKALLRTVKETRKVVRAISLGDRESFFKYEKASIWNNPRIVHKNKEITWKSWMEQNIWSVDQLYDKGELKKFEKLKLSQGNELDNRRDYEVLKCALLKGQKEQTENKQETIIIKIMKALENKENVRTSLIYALLYPDNLKYLCDAAEDWGNELGEEIKEDEWKKWLRSAMAVNLNLADRLRQQRIFLRLNWSPEKMCKLGLLESDLCWKCGEEKGTLSHLIVNCKTVKGWWGKIGDLMSEILREEVVLGWRSILFSDIKEQIYLVGAEKKWVRKGIAVALKIVMRNWKSKATLKLEGWLGGMDQLMEMERVTYRMREVEYVFEGIWGSYRNWRMGDLRS